MREVATERWKTEGRRGGGGGGGGEGRRKREGEDSREEEEEGNNRMRRKEKDSRMRRREEGDGGGRRREEGDGGGRRREEGDGGGRRREEGDGGGRRRKEGDGGERREGAGKRRSSDPPTSLPPSTHEGRPGGRKKSEAPPFWQVEIAPLLSQISSSSSTDPEALKLAVDQLWAGLSRRACLGRVGGVVGGKQRSSVLRSVFSLLDSTDPHLLTKLAKIIIAVSALCVYQEAGCLVYSIKSI